MCNDFSLFVFICKVDDSRLPLVDFYLDRVQNGEGDGSLLSAPAISHKAMRETVKESEVSELLDLW